MIDIINIFLHLDQHLGSAIKDYGIWIYLLFFMIIFLETGLVVTPFLPGDSLIFLAGAFAAAGALDIKWLFIVMTAAGISGDTVNYYMGHLAGKRALHEKIPHVKKEHIDKTYEFYEKHGGKTIVMARFIPFIRTFAPFVAGIARMRYRNFVFYNIAGGILWVAVFLTLGYYSTFVPVLKDNFGLIVWGIIFVTVLPIVIGLFNHRKSDRR